MATLMLTAALRAEYSDLFTTCVIRPNYEAAVEVLVDQLLANQARYQAVEALLGVPWWFVAVTHNMEASLSFNGHLHNGDPLSARTVHVPAGRPKTGGPPFRWEDSAVDALKLKGLSGQTDWTLAGALFQLERYNGSGYRLYHPSVLTPYLWSFSNHYREGKYAADGVWSPTLKSKQCGAAVLLRRMAERRLIGFADQAWPDAADGPLVVPYAIHKSADPAVVDQATALQVWLSSFPGIFVKPDGVPGSLTSDAYKAVTGRYLPGDPRLGQSVGQS